VLESRAIKDIESMIFDLVYIIYKSLFILYF